ncbi:hypothetical protein D3C75_1334480 [compost metagenome]
MEKTKSCIFPYFVAPKIAVRISITKTIMKPGVNAAKDFSTVGGTPFGILI